MQPVLKDPLTSLQAPDLLGTLRRVAEFGKEAGARLRTSRERLGLSQFEAAVQLGVTDKTLGRWEGAKSKPTRQGHWQKIEQVYGVTTAEILGEPEPEQLDRLEAKLDALLGHFKIAVSAGIDPPEGLLEQLADAPPNDPDRPPPPNSGTGKQARRS